MRRVKLLNHRFFISIVLPFFVLAGTSPAMSKSAGDINIEVSAALKRFKTEVPGGKQFLNRARGVLVFPSVIKAGFGIGGEYGEGALQIKGKTVDYYNTAAASIGFQLGAQSKSVILVFRSDQALKDFRNSEGWKAGVDGSVALVEWGAGKDINTVDLKAPIVGFVFGNKGLMYNLTLEGSKYTRIKR
jgi:lipid-binding SYLF domain-containing protein